MSSGESAGFDAILFRSLAGDPGQHFRGDPEMAEMLDGLTLPLPCGPELEAEGDSSAHSKGCALRSAIRAPSPPVGGRSQRFAFARRVHRITLAAALAAIVVSGVSAFGAGKPGQAEGSQRPSNAEILRSVSRGERSGISSEPAASVQAPSSATPPARSMVRSQSPARNERSPVAAPRRAAAVERSQPQPVSPPRCELLYVIDAQRIKRFRPECF